MPVGPYNHLRHALIHGPTPGIRLIHRGGELYQLFDLHSDPNELHVLSRDKSQLFPMVSRMNAFRS
ncbi:hypothetical protein BCY86_04140 [Pajaroellobacter abortibovis]|uniref:N-sulphoglucosamine sulphohydrolase C-terminal domain-containing protein n=1 Tax=Pajaroellobacter abortibovis TaxID=1882918 RepID=A0A1L6MWR2_9BACT|nr:hypothetical protein BCY86_04140 [Pajaroellobacter abortibovis]